MGLISGNFGKGIANFANSVGSFAETIGGLFGGGSVASSQRLLLPNNPLIKDYNIGKDLFKFEISAHTRGKKEIDEDGRTKESEDEGTKEFIMEILYNAPSLSVSHSFDWSEDFISEIAEGTSRVIKGTEKISDATKAIIDSDISALSDAIRKKGGLDIAPTFKGSGKQSVTLNFILLAHTDPYYEVVLPAQLLTYMAYPSIGGQSNNGALNTLVQSINARGVKESFGMAELLKSKNPFSSLTGNDELDNPLRDVSNQVRDEVAKRFPTTGGNNWRYLTAKDPPYWKVRSSNGVYKLDSAHISNLNITYHSPWVAPLKQYGDNYGKSLQFANAIKGIVDSGAQGGSSGIASMVNSIFPNAADYAKTAVSKVGGGLAGPAGEFFRDFSGEKDYGFKGGYPSYAEVQMTFTSNFDKMYAEDWVSDYDNKVSVSKGELANGVFGAANSIIKNVWKK